MSNFSKFFDFFDFEKSSYYTIKSSSLYRKIKLIPKNQVLYTEKSSSIPKNQVLIPKNQVRIPKNQVQKCQIFRNFSIFSIFSILGFWVLGLLGLLGFWVFGLLGLLGFLGFWADRALNRKFNELTKVDFFKSFKFFEILRR